MPCWCPRSKASHEKEACTPSDSGVKISVPAADGAAVGMRSTPGDRFDGHKVDSQFDPLGMLNVVADAVLGKPARAIEPSGTPRARRSVKLCRERSCTQCSNAGQISPEAEASAKACG